MQEAYLDNAPFSGTLGANVLLRLSSALVNGNACRVEGLTLAPLYPELDAQPVTLQLKAISRPI